MTAVRRQAHPFDAGLGRAPKKRPTRRHRPAIWEGMLGAVYASDGVGTRYFDYDWDAARRFAGVGSTEADRRQQDLRLARYRDRGLAAYAPTGYDRPTAAQWVLWIEVTP